MIFYRCSPWPHWILIRGNEVNDEITEKKSLYKFDQRISFMVLMSKSCQVHICKTGDDAQVINHWAPYFVFHALVGNHYFGGVEPITRPSMLMRFIMAWSLIKRDVVFFRKSVLNLFFKKIVDFAFISSTLLLLLLFINMRKHSKFSLVTATLFFLGVAMYLIGVVFLRPHFFHNIF